MFTSTPTEFTAPLCRFQLPPCLRAATVASGVIEFQAECARREVNARTFSPSRGKRCYRAIKRRACSATKALIMPKIRLGLTRKTITRSASVKELDKRFLPSLLARCVNPIHAYTNTYTHTRARARTTPPSRFAKQYY